MRTQWEFCRITVSGMTGRLRDRRPPAEVLLYFVGPDGVRRAKGGQQVPEAVYWETIGCLGANGWEPIHLGEGAAWFKRPIEEGQRTWEPEIVLPDPHEVQYD